MGRSTTLTKHDPFKTAVADEAPPTDKPFKGTTWCSDDDGAAVLKTDLAELNRLAKEATEIETKLEACKTRLTAYANARWLKYWAANADQPRTPVRLVDVKSGASASFVVQDKTRKYFPEPAEVAALVVEFNADFEPFLVESTKYSFDADVLAIRARDPLTEKRTTIQAMVAHRIAPLLESLVADCEITKEQARGLLTVETKRTFDAGFLARLPELCGRDADRLGRAVAAIGSAIVRFVKPA
jgi:hypothetical protein